MTTAEILLRLQNVSQVNGGWQATCPAHPDSTPSLSISEGKGGKTLMSCHAGCKIEQIVAVMNLQMSDLFPPIAKPQLVETYDYQDAMGNLLYQVCRYFPKNFKQRRPDGQGGFKWSMKGVERVLYRLPDVVTAIAAKKVVFIVEGEKDVHALQKLGIHATCNPGGASNWLPQYTESLTGASIIIIADKDKAGREHAQLVAGTLYGKASGLRVLELPNRGTTKVKDAYDWVSAGGNLEELREIINKTPKWELPPPQLETPELDERKPAEKEDFYYDKDRKEYLLLNSRKCWLSLVETQFKKELALRGLHMHKDKKELVSEADKFIINLRDKRDVDYVGSLAGFKSGLYKIDGRRVLVTDSPNIIEPAPGTWGTIDSVIYGLLRDETHKQQDYLYGWLKVAYESLRAGKLRPGQVLAMSGPHDCGKSLLQQIITVILGGRSAKPYEYMTDATTFNSDMFKSEHLCIEDEPASTDIRTRRAFGAQIKQIAACDTQRCHAKHREAITLTPFWRLTISLNDEPENLMVLPPIDNSIEDKIIIFRTSSFQMPMPTKTVEERSAFWQLLISEIPAFMDHLCKWKIATELSSERYGVTHFHHPDLLQEIDALSPEYRLLMIINKELFGDIAPMSDWTGTAEDLESRLTGEGAFQHESRKLLSWANAAGTYLARLSKKYPDRVTYERTKHRRTWTIKPE